MSKVLKIAAIAIGVTALAFTGIGLAVGLGAAATSFGIGVSASTLFLVSSGLSLASGLLAKRPKAPATSDNAKDRLQVSIDPRTPRKFVLGRTAMATDLRDTEIIGSDQSYVDRFIVVASHTVHLIEEIWFDDKMAWSSSGGVTGNSVGYLTVQAILEGNAGNAINISARMGSSRRYTGCAYVYLRFKLTGNSKNVTSPFQQSLPSRMTIVGKGAKVYDPRLDSTVPGGSGSQRANDQTTWAWNDSASRNPALQTLWYLLGWRIQNPVTSEWRLAVGKGIPPARLNLESFITAANACDESVALLAGGSEPRYRGDGVFSEGDPTGTVLEQLKATMNAELDDVDGRLRLLVLYNDLATPIADFSEDDILDDFNWDQTTSLDDTFNIVRGTYVDPSANSLYQNVDYPEVRIASPDGIDRIETVDLQMVQSPSQAQRLAKQRVARMLYSGMFSATFGHRAWKVQRADVVRLTFSPLGWTNKLFRVVDTSVQVNGQVPMTLREEHSDIYLWDKEEAPAVAAVAPTTYDPAKDALYTYFLDNAGFTGLLTNESHTVPADSGGNVTSYAGATGSFKIYSGGVDVSSNFALSTAPSGNPQALTVGYVGQVYTVTAGLDAGETGATLTIRATGSGAYSGLTIDKVFTLGKSVAGSTGATPPIVLLTADFWSFDYDTTGAIKPRTIKYSAQRNVAATTQTQWTVRDKTGFALYGPANATTMASTGTFTRIDDDTITMSHTQFAGLLSGDPTNRASLTFEATSSGITDKVSTVLLKDGAAGASTFTLVAGSNVAITPSSIEKVNATGAWDSSAYSLEGYIGDVEASAQCNDVTKGFMFGLSVSPTANESYTGIDYPLYCYASAIGGTNVWYAFVPGASGPTLANGDVIRIRRRGTTIEYSVNGAAPFYTQTGVSATAKLYLDSSFLSTNAKLVNVTFKPVGGDGAPGIAAFLTNEAHTVPADSAGNVTSYAGATGSFKVYAGSIDVSASFSLSTVSNPQSLTIGYAGMVYTISAGLDAGEANATATIRATGSGAFAGITVDRIFSLGKSVAGAGGAAGAASKLLYVASTHQTFRYNTSGVIQSQTTTLTATRQNTAVATNWTMRKPDGTIIGGPASAAAFVATWPSYFSSSANDNLSINDTGFAAFLTAYTLTGLIFETSLTDGVFLSDQISIVKVQDGAAGAAGINALTISTTPGSVSVPCYSSGTPKAGTPTVQINVFQGGTDVHATATYGTPVITPSGSLGSVSVSSSGVITASLAADTGTVTVPISNGSANGSASVTYTKTKDGVAGGAGDHYTIPGGTSIGTSYTNLRTASFNAGPNGSIALAYNVDFTTGLNSARIEGYFEIIVGATTYGPYAVGDSGFITSFDAGSCSGSQTVSGSTIGLTSFQTVTVKFWAKRTGGTGSPAYAIQGSSLTDASWV